MKTWTQLRKHWYGLTLGVLAAAGAGLVLVTQVVGRPPLFWDEAVRVFAGRQFASAVMTGDAGAVWSWLNAQVFYPPLTPILHGVAFILGASPLVAAWFPSLIIYVLSGLLVARLSRRLGAGSLASLGAVLLFWSFPIVMQLSASAMTELPGACLLLLAALGIARTQDPLTRHRTLGLALVLSASWFLKYDYALVVNGAVGVLFLWTILRHQAELGRRLFFSLFASVITLFGWIAVSMSEKLRGIYGFVFQAAGNTGANGSERGLDLLYYPRQLLSGVEIGVNPLTSLLLLLGLILAIRAARHNPVARGILILLFIWMLLYTTASIKWARYLVVTLPLLAVLSAGAIEWLMARCRSLRASRRRFAEISLSALLGVGLLAQLTQLTPGYIPPLYAGPNPTSEWVISTLVMHLAPRTSCVLLLGMTNEVSPYGLTLAMEVAGAPLYVDTVGQMPPEQQSSAFEAHLRADMSCLIVGIDVPPGSRLDTPDWRAHHTSEPVYLVMAQALEKTGGLQRQFSSTFTDGTGLTIWAPVSGPRS